MPVLLLAQRGFRTFELPPNPTYDGRFTYARIKYSMGDGGFGGFGRGGPTWLHDYPDADRHFPKIVQELTSLQVRPDESVIVSADDPELMKFPFAYICEPGFWLPTEPEVQGMRNYLLKGGFLLFDDFDGSHWYNFESPDEGVLRRHRSSGSTSTIPLRFVLPDQHATRNSRQTNGGTQASSSASSRTTIPPSG